MKHLFSYKGTKTQRFKVFAFLFSSASFAQEIDSTKTKNLEEVMVQSIRVNEKIPVTFSNFSKKEIAKRNLGQDIPILMNFLPSVVTTSDAGNGVGYTGIRVRGSDASRVNVTINGIPYNDSESHGTFWVNMPDFASSLESIQLQRGVGTSTNGAGAFGASLNILTENSKTTAGAEIANSFGSFNTRKHTIKFNTGLLNEHLEFSGRVSQINSDGFIDRAKSNLKSYFLQGTYTGKTSKIKALVFGGKEITYQSWFGVDETQLKKSRTYNPAGIYTDAVGNTRFYDNEVDNYQQDHYQLHWNEQVNQNLSTNFALHYTKGKGYFEQFKEDEPFTNYNFTPIVIGSTTIDTTDIIRRRWLDNDFYGMTFSVNYSKNKLDFIFGGGANKYEGKHFGEVIWAQYASNSMIRDRYYDNFGLKTDVNFYGKINYQLTQKLRFYGDLQWRNVNYQANNLQPKFVNDTFNFINPKAGIVYNSSEKHNFYFSYAKAQREPKREDYENNNVKPEKLNDFELGWRYKTETIKINTNGYYMLYKDQLVLSGALNNVGTPLSENSGKSYRVGLEIDAKINLGKQWFIQPNVAVSESKNKDFKFQRDGILRNLGKTTISFSPNLVAGNILGFSPIQSMQIALLSKYVGKQYMGNIEAQSSILDSYFTNDLNFVYTIDTKKITESITFSVLVNNLLNTKYISNGYFYTYDDTYTNPPIVTTIEGTGYYPQAGINILAGVILTF